MTIAILITFFTSMLIGIPLFIALLTAGFVGFIFIGDLSLLKIIPHQ
jgi:hypothetical protein